MLQTFVFTTMRTKRIKNLLVICFLPSLFLFSQQNDFQTWNSVELKYDKIKDFNLGHKITGAVISQLFGM